MFYLSIPDDWIRWLFWMTVLDACFRWLFQMTVLDDYFRWLFQMPISDDFSRWVFWMTVCDSMTDSYFTEQFLFPRLIPISINHSADWSHNNWFIFERRLPTAELWPWSHLILKNWAWTFIHTSWALQYVSERVLFSRLFEGLIGGPCI